MSKGFARAPLRIRRVRCEPEAAPERGNEARLRGVLVARPVPPWNDDGRGDQKGARDLKFYEI